MNDFDVDEIVGSVSSPVSLEEMSTLCQLFFQSLNKFESQLIERNLLKRENSDVDKVDENVKKSKENLMMESRNLKGLLQENKGFYINTRDEKQYQKIRAHFQDLYKIYERLMSLSQKLPESEKKSEPVKQSVASNRNEETLEQVLQKEHGLSTSDYQRIQLEKLIQSEKQSSLEKLEEEMRELNTCYTDLDQVLKEQSEALIPAAQNVENASSYMEQGVHEIKTVRKAQKWNHCKLYLLMACIFLTLMSVGVVLFFVFLPKNSPPREK